MKAGAGLEVSYTRSWTKGASAIELSKGMLVYTPTGYYEVQ